MLIYAPNVHQGGGKILLQELLRVSDKDTNILFCDSRFNCELDINLQRHKVKPTVPHRIISEFLLFSKSATEKKILCFGNLPPLLPLFHKADLFFQNALLISKNTDLKLPLKTKLKLIIEKCWLRIGMYNIRHVYIQSISLKEKFEKEFPHKKVILAPFAPTIINSSASGEVTYDFLYVASGDPHKNHLNLLSAWELLSQKGLYPKLLLTVPLKYATIIKTIKNLQKKGLLIENKENLLHEEVLSLYKISKALIYPSLTESFGLPLIEAQASNIPIIASELDYVRDFVDPIQTFDPSSSKSIAKAVIRYLRPSMLTTQNILTAQQFLNILDREL